MYRVHRHFLRPIGLIVAAVALFGCGGDEHKANVSDPKWEEAHATALAVIELINVKRAATDRSYYYPREVADVDSDGVYEAIVGWHPTGGLDGTDLLWRVVGDTILMSQDSAMLWHDGVRMHFDSGTIRSTYPLWSADDSVCCPSREVIQQYRVEGDHVQLLLTDTVPRK